MQVSDFQLVTIPAWASRFCVANIFYVGLKMSKPGHDVSHIQAIEITLAVPSLDGDPDGLTPTLGLDDIFNFL